MRDDMWDEVDLGRLQSVCHRYGITALFVFGSVARGEPTPTSDVDLLYELGPGVRLGWEIEDLSDELAAVFGRPVDLISRASIHPLLRAAIIDEARPVYAA